MVTRSVTLIHCSSEKGESEYRVISHLYPNAELCYKPNIEPTAFSPRRFPGTNSAAGSGAPFPAPAHEQQDAVFAPAFELIQQAIADRVFPAASVAITHQGNLVGLKAFGRFTYEPDSPAATTATIFDLASVTKVVATTSMAMMLYERGLLDLDLPVVAVVAEFAGEDPRRDAVTLRMLLAHSSGLPAYEKLFMRAKTRDELLSAAFATPLTANPGAKTEYSDIGFILLGAALERIAEESLDRFCQHEVFGPLAMTHTAFNPPSAWQASIAPTANDQSFRHRIIQGEVQDENASVMGGVAGHTRACLPAPRISPPLPTPCFLADAPSFARKRWRCSPAGSLPRQAHRAPWVGTRRHPRHNPENTSRAIRSAISATPEPRCGSTQTASCP